jgi:hypothetical protein
MGAAESAGVVAKTNWNNASGPASSTPLALKGGRNWCGDGATVTRLSDSTWSTPVTDQAGNNRMMKGYLDLVSAARRP